MATSKNSKIDTIIAKLTEACVRTPPNRKGAIAACVAELRGYSDVHYKPALQFFLKEIEGKENAPGQLTKIADRIEAWVAATFPTGSG